MTMRITSFFMVPILPNLRALRPGPATGGRRTAVGRSDGEEVARSGIRGRVAQLRHGSRLDLSDPLTGQVEVLPDLLERPGLTAVEAEAEPEDLPLALVER